MRGQEVVQVLEVNSCITPVHDLGQVSQGDPNLLLPRCFSLSHLLSIRECDYELRSENFPSRLCQRRGQTLVLLLNARPRLSSE